MNKNTHFAQFYYFLRKIRYSEKNPYGNYLLRICNYCSFNAKKKIQNSMRTRNLTDLFSVPSM